MGGLGMHQILGFIIGAVAFAVTLAMWPTIQVGNAEVYNQFSSHCLIDGRAVTRVHVGAVTTNITGSTADGPCLGTGLAASATNIVDEYGRTHSATATAGTLQSDGWVVLPAVMSRFSSVNRLVAGILPIIYVASMIGFAVIVYRGQATGGITGHITGAVVGTVIYVAGVVLLPTILGFVVTAATDGNSGANYAVNDSFGGSLLQLLWQLIPTILLIGIAALIPSRTGAYGAAYGYARNRFGGM